MKAAFNVKFKSRNWFIVTNLGILAFTAGIGESATFTALQFLTGNTASGEVLNTAGTVVLTSTGSVYNTIDNTTGVKLVTSNGDPADFTLAASNTGGALANTPTTTLNPGSDFLARIRHNHGYTGAVSSNNPGTVSTNIFTLTFSSDLTVTNAVFNFSSLNTHGIAWEYSTLEFLNPSGVPFNPITGLDFTPGSPSQYTAGLAAGFTGQAGVGNYVSASKGTVTGVGTANAVSGTGGTGGASDNLGSFDYSTAGLTVGTVIGGIRWTTYLEDVRGTGNGNTNFTSSLLDFTITGSAVPEPSVGLLALLSGLALSRRKR